MLVMKPTKPYGSSERHPTIVVRLAPYLTLTYAGRTLKKQHLIFKHSVFMDQIAEVRSNRIKGLANYFRRVVKHEKTDIN